MKPKGPNMVSVYTAREYLPEPKLARRRNSREISMRGTRIVKGKVIYHGDLPLPVTVGQHSEQPSQYVRRTSAASPETSIASHGSPSPIKRLQKDRTVDTSMSQHSVLSELEEMELSAPNSSDSEEEENVAGYNEKDLSQRLTVNPLEPHVPCAPQAGKTFLILPLFEGRPPTVIFDYPPQCLIETRLNSRCFAMPENEKGSKKLMFKVSEKAPAYNCILNSFKHAGFEQTKSHKFNIIISKVPTPMSLRWLSSYQRFNHFPGAWNLGRKDNLWRNVWRMKRAFGAEYEICPMTYLFPEDYDRFMSDKEVADSGALWILKPAASSCGRGIRVISRKTKLKRKKGYIVSKYISNPHTLNGFKYDLRIYVVVTCFNPLRIYMFQDGLARFATEAYSSHTKTIAKRYMHLTNYSVNRKAPSFQVNKDAQQDNDGSKWSLKAWKAKMAELGVDVKALMGRVHDVVIKALIAVEPPILNKLAASTQHREVCFELYGFDILIDDKLRPWLLEVNVGPSLSSSAPIDKRIKTTLMCDIYTLVGIAPYDRKKLKKIEELKKHSRLIRSERAVQHPALNAVKECSSLDEVALSQAEIAALMELEEENQRRGHFERIFPKKTNIDRYAQFFESDRLLNWVTWKYLKYPCRALAPYRSTF